jgi:hypothetical protein
MASQAFGRQRFEQQRFPLSGREGHVGFDVASAARKRGVFAPQGERAAGLMVEFQFVQGKTLGRMTCVAGGAELTEMDIAMAIRTCRGNGLVRRMGVAIFMQMAFLAGHGSMLAGQREAGSAVIERRFFEAFHHMTVLAFFAEFALVGIPAMAICAAAESDFPVLLIAGVALNAGQGTVFSPQRETGLIMAEGGGFPGALLVAGAAIFSE